MLGAEDGGKRSLKRILPQSLFGRALLILAVPTILVQLVATYVFYDRHWSTVSRWMASSLAGEIALLVHEVNHAPAQRQQEWMRLAEKLVYVQMTLDESASQEPFLRQGQAISPVFFNELEARINLPLALRVHPEDADSLIVQVKIPDGVLNFSVTRKRLVSSTTYIFVSWMLGTALLLTSIAVVFLRNQIRPIRKLAQAMENFGKGLEIDGFKVHGALEVQQAGRAFLMMRRRIDRQISARMEMLAGISHDLRTPLTRMRLQIAMLPDPATAEDLLKDVADMEAMIAEYLDFVRGEGQEKPVPEKIKGIVQEVLAGYRRQNHDIPLEFRASDDAELMVRPQVFRRALMNVVDNGLRYGKTVRVVVEESNHAVEIRVIDAGCGIPAEMREEVFRPFKRLESSRNVNSGGVGLGLTITRDIIHAHGGSVLLQDAEPNGLMVTIRMPR